MPVLAGRHRMSRTRLGAALAVVLLALLAVAATALGASPPQADTGVATVVSGTSETLNGFVNPSGSSTTFHFDWGLSTRYGRATSTGNAGTGTDFKAESATLSGLTPGTTYHFRIVAVNGSATVDGFDQSFTAGQPQVNTLAPTAIVGDGATLNGVINPSGSSTTYRFDYGVDMTYGTSTSSKSGGSGNSNVTESATVSGLTPGVTYHYRIEATNLSGTVFGADQTFTPGQAQATTGSVTSPTNQGGTLNGTVNPGGLSTTYQFEYGSDASYGSATTVHDAGSGTAGVSVTAALSGLATGATYHYRLVASNAGGTVFGDDASFVPGQAHASTLAASAVGSAGAALNASINAAGQATTYHFEYGTSVSYGTSTADTNVGAGSNDLFETVPVGALRPSTTYHYRVVASNATGVVPGSDATFTTTLAGSQAPSLGTSPPTTVTSSSATLNGAVNPNGLDTTYYFEYGTGITYGTQTTVTDVGSGFVPVAGSAALSGLSSNTIYHYRLVASNGRATTRSADQTLSTFTQPSATTGSASAVTDTTATLNSTVDPNGFDTAYHFEYGTDTAYGQATSPLSAGSGTTPQAASAPVTGLVPGTTYHFRVVASNGGGATFGGDQSFTSPVPPTATTAGPSGVGNTAATVNGSVNPNGIATTYTFEYGTDTNYGTSTPSQSAGAGTSAQAASVALTGLSPATTFHYRAVATNGADTVFGADQTFTTTGTAAAPTISGSVAKSVTDTGASLEGAINANGQPTSYQVEWGTDTSYGGGTIPSQSAGAGWTARPVAAPIAGLSPGTTYHFRLVASSSAGVTTGPDQNFTTFRPPSATTGAATAISQTRVTLNGSVNPDGFETTYSFQYGTGLSYGSTTSSQDAGFGASPRAAVAAVTGLDPGTTYHFRVVATNGTDTVFGLDQTFTTTVAPDVTTGTASGVDTTVATLNGTVNPNGSPTTVVFQYGTDTSYGASTTMQSAGSGTTSQAASAPPLTGLTAGMTYHFRITASAGGATVFGSDQMFTTTPPPQPPTVTSSSAAAVTDTSATLSGSVNPSGQATTYQFEYGLDTGYGFTLPTPAPSVGSGSSAVSESLPIAGLAPGTTYHFRLVATNGTGATASPDATFTTPTPPSSTTGAATAVSATGATLNASVNPNGFATTYQFRYGTDTSYGSTPTSSQSVVPTDTSSHPVSASISSLTPGTTYHFQVVATNGVDTVTGGDQTFSTPPAPTVSTGPATGVDTSAATLSGVVNPNGSATTYQFQYGTDTGYGSSTPPQSAGSTSTPQAVSAPVTTLVAATTYHYRLVATSASGTTPGADQAFTTADNPPAGGQPGVPAPGGAVPGAPVPSGPAPGGTPVAPSGPAPLTGPAAAPTVSFGGPASEKLAGSTVVVLTGIKVTCPSAGPCGVSVLATGLSRARRGKSTKATLASTRPSVASGRSLAITLKLSARTLKRVLNGRSALPMTITLVVRGRDGKPHNYIRTISVHKPKKGTIRLKG